jgi:hypothetical protein
MKDLADLIEHNRFVGREFLLWLWFESELFEANLRPTGAAACSLWIETRLALAFETDDAVLKSASPARSAEAKQALRQGKLPREARLHVVVEDREYGCLLKADTLALSSVALPTELGKKDEIHEVFYERMRLLGELESILEALWSDFLALRLGPAYPKLLGAWRAWAHGEPVDEKAYRALKSKALEDRKAHGRPKKH